jgi:hypothetical protein
MFKTISFIITLWIPITIVDYDNICSSQVDAKTTCFSTQQKNITLEIVLIESFSDEKN